VGKELIVKAFVRLHAFLSQYTICFMALFITHRCPKCFESVTLIQPQHKGGAFNACLGGSAMKRILFLLVFISVAPGCLFFALPLPAEHGQEIDKVQSQIVVGKTTREDVISILGEPDVTEDRSISYFNKVYNGGWFVLSLPGRGARIKGQEFMDLYFEFDNYGVLTDCGTHKFEKSWIYVKDDEDTSKMEEARDQGKESCFTSTTEKLQCVNKVVICVQECSERFGNNPGIEASDKAACQINCDESLNVCFESL